MKSKEHEDIDLKKSVCIISNQWCANPNPDSDSNPDSRYFGLDSDSDLDSDLKKLNPDSDSGKKGWIRIRIRIRIRAFACRSQPYSKIHYIIKIVKSDLPRQLPMGAGHCPWGGPLNVSDSNPDSDSKQLDSDSDSRKIRWIRIRVDSDSRLLDSDPDSDSRCLDSHITVSNAIDLSLIHFQSIFIEKGEKLLVDNQYQLHCRKEFKWMILNGNNLSSGIINLYSKYIILQLHEKGNDMLQMGRDAKAIMCYNWSNLMLTWVHFLFLLKHVWWIRPGVYSYSKEKLKEIFVEIIYPWACEFMYA